MTVTVNPTVNISSVDANLTIGTASNTYTVSSPAWNTTSDVCTIATGWSAGANLSNGTSGKISLQGKDADIEINGASLVAMLKRIEERVNLLTVNHELESEWEELRELGNQYRELEQRIKDKLETWKKLQSSEKDNR
jgi:hypothetical protein